MVNKRLADEGVPDDVRIEAILSAISQINFLSRLKGVGFILLGLALVFLGIFTLMEFIEILRLGAKQLVALSMGGLIFDGLWNLSCNP